MSKTQFERLKQRITVRQFNAAMIRSHKLQGEGVDYQEAASVAAAENGIDPLSEEYNFLTEPNGPGCECPFCIETYADCAKSDLIDGD